MFASDGGGLIPTQLGQCEFKLVPDFGFSSIGLKVDGATAAMAGVAWEGYGQAEQFAMVHGINNQMLRAHRQAGSEATQVCPEQLPWLAITFSPTYFNNATDAQIDDAISLLGAMSCGVIANCAQAAARN